MDVCIDVNIAVTIAILCIKVTHTETNMCFCYLVIFYDDRVAGFVWVCFKLVSE